MMASNMAREASSDGFFRPRVGEGEGDGVEGEILGEASVMIGFGGVLASPTFMGTTMLSPIIYGCQGARGLA